MDPETMRTADQNDEQTTNDEKLDMLAVEDCLRAIEEACAKLRRILARRQLAKLPVPPPSAAERHP